MATGGTIPTSRTQSVTFYNTSGIIEKDKLIYLVPRFKNVISARNKEVRSAFLMKLTATCPPPSAYSGIQIGSWSPQDRSLVVKGNIDDFRLVTEEGDCLNYFIITRNVTKGEGQQAVTKTYYYGFFITGVEQVGGSSVKLTVEPDDFTNVFYLHNEHVLTADDITNDYEPFNERMSNCYVNRQHYNRVKGSVYWLLKITIVLEDPRSVDVGTFQVGESISFEFNDGNDTRVRGTITNVDDSQAGSGIIKFWVRTKNQSEIGAPVNFSFFDYGIEYYVFDYDNADISWEEVVNLAPDNLKIFLNQNESFKFKYQYKDKKLPIALSQLFVEEELELVKETPNFNSLPENLRKKILRACMQFFVVELKSSEKIGLTTKKQIEPSTSSPLTLERYFSNYVGGFRRACPTIFRPLMNVPEVFNKYKTEIMQFSYTFVKFKNSNVDMGVYTIGTAYDLYKSINYTLSDFVYSAYIVNDIGLPSDRIDFDLTNHRFILECDITPETNAEKGLSVIALNPPEWEGSDNVWGIVYLYAESSLINLVAVRYEGCYPVFMLSGYDSRDITLDIEDSVEKNVKTEYYDPVLEAEPYSFYSLAYLSYEMPFNKNRYYVSNEIKIRYYVSVNGAIKLYYIPTYLVEDKEFNYYNEGLTFTLPSSLPLMSDSYASYYYQNKAQMKNQFAVNDYNRGVDLAQHFFLSGPNAVGQSAFKRGGYGAIAETINQFAQMGDEVIDWGQSNKVIEMNQKAKLADMGAKPDNVKQVGSDVLADLLTTENRPYVNHYKIDEASYNSISKFLERFGYEVGLYDSIHANDRVGWNFVKLTSFDWHGAEIMVEQEDNIKKIFNQGVTMLHDKSYLTSGHNYETILDE